MVELKRITKVFETEDGEFTALKDVNLTVADGDIYGIIGMSGAGKSTLVRCINMLERPTEGEILIDGRDVLQDESRGASRSAAQHHDDIPAVQPAHAANMP